MKLKYLFILLLVVTLCAQTPSDITSKVTVFKAVCLDEFEPTEETPPNEPQLTQEKKSVDDFNLLKFESSKNNSLLSFQIIANCGQRNKGQFFINQDTLIIKDTDIVITKEIYTKQDSLGNMIEVTEEIHTSEYTSCDCLIRYDYNFEYNLSRIKYLKFHDRNLILKR